jgi:hypothetical protein
MEIARAEAPAAALPDGLVLIAGGHSAGPFASAELFVPAAEARIAGGDFGQQTVGGPSGVQTLVVSNMGAQQLTVSGASLAATATLRTSRSPPTAAPAPRSATARPARSPRASHRPRPERGPRQSTWPTTRRHPRRSPGTGVAVNSGPSGTPGAPGAPGGPGEVELVTCTTATKTVVKHHRKRKVKVRKCTTKLVPGPVKFTTARVTRTRTEVQSTGMLSAGPSTTYRWRFLR